MLRLQNPHVPCNEPLNGSVTHGFNLTVTGYPTREADRFSINLMSESMMQILHFNPRFPERTVVLNTRTDDGWGTEQRPPPFPLERNHIFRVNIRAEPQAFKIFINDALFAKYPHRQPLSSIKSINVTGDVIIQEILSTTGAYMLVPVPVPEQIPYPYIPDQAVAAVPSAPAGPVDCTGGRKHGFDSIQVTGPSVPLTIQLPGNMQEHMVFNVMGAPTASFKLTWMCSNGDKAFIFDVKFDVPHNSANPQTHVNKILRNSFQFGAVGAEESVVPFFPFVIKMNFDLAITCRPNFYEVKVNGQPLLNFKHRIYPVNTVSALMIEGGLTLSSVTVKQ